VNGRKRFCLVDTNGWAIRIVVLPANASDQEGARRLLENPDERFERLEVIWADQGFRSDELSALVQWNVGAQLVITGQTTAGYWLAPGEKRPDAGPTPRTLRWVVERSFAWLGRNRRLARDYEFLPESEETFCYLAMAHLILKTLTR
jgi:putative transposase